jgi:glycosyltransferase involved in cell wall biosynthesis
MKLKILLISPVPTHPQDAGNRIRIFQLAEQLRTEGCDLYFAYYDHEMAGGDYAQMRNYWGLKGIYLSIGKPKILSSVWKCIENGLLYFKNKKDPTSVSTFKSTEKPLDIDIWNIKHFDDVLLNHHSREHFHVIFVEYVFLSGILERFNSNVVKVIDTHDIFTDRYKMFTANKIDPEWFYTNLELEKRGLDRADYIIAIKDTDALFFKNMGLSNVLTIGHFFPPQIRSANPDRNVDLLFIGSDNISNVKAWEYFTAAILDQILKQIPYVSIHVAGRICEKISDSPNYHKIGTISDLSQIYRSVKVAINPVTFGTGLKIKTIEPLAFGCPVVTTPVGIEGIEDAIDQGILVGATPMEFVNHVVSLLTKSSIYKEQQDLGYKYFAHYQAQNKHNLKTLLANIETRIEGKIT